MERHLVFAGRNEGDQQLYIRDLNSWQARPLPGTEGAISPFFSPDGQWIAFFTMDKLKKVPVNGGPTITLAPVTNPRGGSWGIDGNIVFAAGPTSGLSLVSSEGGAVQALTTLDRSGGSHRFPHHLPNGRDVLFTVGTGGRWDDARIEILELASNKRKVLFDGGSDARYVPTGYLVYLRDGALMAVRFNPDRLEISGSPVSVVEGVLTSTDNTGAAQAAVSELGALAYVPGDRHSLERTLAWTDRKGAEQALSLPPRFYRTPRVSPDGQRVVVDIDEGNKSDLWLYDILRGTLTRKTFDGTNAFGIWTPDGKRITFQTSAAEKIGLASLSVDGTESGEILTTRGNNVTASSWSPDGQTLAFHEFDPGRGRDIWMLNLKEGRKPQPFLQTPFSETSPAFSTDGRWIAYDSDESGRLEIYVRPFPGPGSTTQVSTDGGSTPVWSADGHELFYRDGDKMMAVSITLQPTFHPSQPQVLFERPYSTPSFYPRNYDVTPDGRRFLMIKENEQVSAATVINVVTNWLEELKQRLPVN
jgi:Tol biopolymer transport system component